MTHYWYPRSTGVSYVFAFFALGCWGSWTNLFKLAGTRFELFVWDYAMGSLLTALIICPVFAAIPPHSAEQSHLGFWYGLTVGACLESFFAGPLNMLGLILAMSAVEARGMAFTIPLIVGIEIVVGTILLWLIERKEDPALLFSGVVFTLLAVACEMLSHLETEKGESTSYAIQINEDHIDMGHLNEGSIQLTKSDHTSGSGVELGDTGASTTGINTDMGGDLSVEDESYSCKKMFMSKWRIPMICCLSGLCFALWPVLSALANASSNAPESEGTAQGELSPYAFFLLFRIGGLLGAACTLPWFMKNPILVGKRPCNLREDYFGFSSQNQNADASRGLTTKQHVLALTGGAMWTVGTLAMIISGKTLGLGVSVSIGRCAPLVATLWGVTVWKEMAGTSKRAKRLIGTMCILYLIALTLISASSST